MRRSLGVLVGGMTLVAAMALPAGAATATAHPGMDRDRNHGRDHSDRDADRHRNFRRDDHGRDHRRPYSNSYPYSYGYYGSYPPYGCPGGGYYDGYGTYWYWDPADHEYETCPY